MKQILSACKKRSTPRNILLLVILGAVLYRGGVAHSTLLICLLVVWGFFFFDHRYFAYLAGAYLLGAVYNTFGSDTLAVEQNTIYAFRYIFFAFMSSFISSEKEEVHKLT